MTEPNCIALLDLIILENKTKNKKKTSILFSGRTDMCEYNDYY